MQNLEPYQLWLLMAAIAYVAFLAGRASANKGGDREERRMLERQEAELRFSELPADVQARVDERIMAGKTIEAIKIAREASGAGLKDAKQMIDARRAGFGRS